MSPTGLSGAEKSPRRLLPLRLSGATAKGLLLLLGLSKEQHGGSKKDCRRAIGLRNKQPTNNR
jgi:hypothetical protein